MRLLAAALLILGAASVLSACSCAPPPEPKKALEHASAVCLAEVVKVDADGQELTVTLKVVRWWKGGDREELVVSTAKDGATCGYHFEKGKKYLVYARAVEQKPKHHVSLCSRTRTEKEAEKSGDFKELGEGNAPKK